jgi:hypothetical protein
MVWRVFIVVDGVTAVCTLDGGTTLSGWQGRWHARALEGLTMIVVCVEAGVAGAFLGLITMFAVHVRRDISVR